MASSFAVIFLDKNSELYLYSLDIALKTLKEMIKQKNVTFAENWKKQIIMFVLLALNFQKCGK